MKKITVNLVDLYAPKAVLNAVAKPYKNEEPTIDLVKKIVLVKKHKTISEHIVMTWEILGSSRLELQEHMRHRMASPTVESTRFSLKKIIKSLEENTDPSHYFTHPLLSLPDFDYLSDKDKQLFEDMFQKHIQYNVDLMKRLQDTPFKNDLMKYFLPECLRTNLTWTINLSSLYNFFNLRLDKYAHFEIRFIANMMLGLLQDTWVEPLLQDYMK